MHKLQEVGGDVQALGSWSPHRQMLLSPGDSDEPISKGVKQSQGTSWKAIRSPPKRDFHGKVPWKNTARAGSTEALCEALSVSQGTSLGRSGAKSKAQDLLSSHTHLFCLLNPTEPYSLIQTAVPMGPGF